jgi:hypothetical protein
VVPRRREGIVGIYNNTIGVKETVGSLAKFLESALTELCAITCKDVIVLKSLPYLCTYLKLYALDDRC